MISGRTLRWLGGKVLPEVLKRGFRGRLYGYRESACPPAFRLEPDGEGYAAVFPGEVRLRLPASMREDILFYAGTNGASVEELEGFRRAASETGGLLFDVGAHRALFTHVFCLARPENRAVAFEPSPVLDDDGRALAALNGIEDRVHFRRAAIGATAGSVGARIDALGFFHAAEPGEADATVAEVTSLDAECERLGAAPDVVKIDIEGYEDQALAGAGDLMRSRKPLLFLELHLDLLESRGVPPREVVGVLEGHGYRFHTPLGKPLSARAVFDTSEAVTRLVAR